VEGNDLPRKEEAYSTTGPSVIEEEEEV